MNKICQFKTDNFKEIFEFLHNNIKGTFDFEFKHFLADNDLEITNRIYIKKKNSSFELSLYPFDWIYFEDQLPKKITDRAYTIIGTNILFGENSYE